MTKECSVVGCEAAPYRRLLHPNEGEIEKHYCKKHVAAAINHWGGVEPENVRFPEQSDQPTSRVPQLAKEETVQKYQVVECPECGSEAYAKARTVDIVFDGMEWSCTCRQCQFGSRILSEKSYYGRQWHRVREWVLDRDGHTCQECGQEDGVLHVHHNRKLVYYETVEEANEPDNLTTLCADCHDDVESVEPPKKLHSEDVVNHAFEEANL